MKECDDLVMLQKTRLFWTWFAEVANQCCRWVSASPVRIDEAGREVKVSSMAIPIRSSQSSQPGARKRDCQKRTCRHEGADRYIDIPQMPDPLLHRPKH